MPDETGPDPSRRYLIVIHGVLQVEAPNGEQAYEQAEAWVQQVGQQAQEAIRAESEMVRVRWLRTEPESETFPGWKEGAD